MYNKESHVEHSGVEWTLHTAACQKARKYTQNEGVIMQVSSLAVLKNFIVSINSKAVSA